MSEICDPLFPSHASPAHERDLDDPLYHAFVETVVHLLTETTLTVAEMHKALTYASTVHERARATGRWRRWLENDTQAALRRNPPPPTEVPGVASPD